MSLCVCHMILSVSQRKRFTELCISSGGLFIINLYFTVPQLELSPGAEPLASLLWLDGWDLTSLNVMATVSLPWWMRVMQAMSLMERWSPQMTLRPSRWWICRTLVCWTSAQTSRGQRRRPNSKPNSCQHGITSDIEVTSDIVVKYVYFCLFFFIFNYFFHYFFYLHTCFFQEELYLIYFCYVFDYKNTSAASYFCGSRDQFYFPRIIWWRKLSKENRLVENIYFISNILCLHCQGCLFLCVCLIRVQMFYKRKPLRSSSINSRWSIKHEHLNIKNIVFDVWSRIIRFNFIMVTLAQML